MSLLIFAYRKLDITRQKSDLNFRLMQVSQKLMDLQQYAANIADGNVSMSDMMNTPGSMFGRQLMYMQYAHNSSLFGAQQQMAMLAPQIQMQMSQMGNPAYQAMYQQWIFKSLYDQQRQLAGKREQKLLNEQEKQIQAEKAKIETQLKLLDQELAAVKEGEDKAVQNWKPQYTA